MCLNRSQHERTQHNLFSMIRLGGIYRIPVTLAEPLPGLLASIRAMTSLQILVKTMEVLREAWLLKSPSTLHGSHALFVCMKYILALKVHFTCFMCVNSKIF